MKIKFLITAIIAAISISVYAQKPPAGGPPGGMHGQRQGGMRRGGGMFGNPDLQKQLNLSAAQKTRIQAIEEKYRAKFRAIFGDRPVGGRPGQGQGGPGGKNGAPPRMQMDPAKMKQFQAVRESEMKEINGVLNAKQKVVLKKWIAAHPPRFGRGGGRPGGPGGPGGRPGGPGHGV